MAPRRDHGEVSAPQRATMTADEYRELIQAYIDQARADQSIAERLAEEAQRGAAAG